MDKTLRYHDPVPAELVTIANFRDLPEAMLAKGKLESAGIECFLGDDNMVRMDWFWSNLIGGVKLRVAETDAEEAIHLLEEEIPPELVDSDTGEVYAQPACPRCSSLDISFGPPDKGVQLAALYMAGIPLPAGRDRWKCSQCGAEWEVLADVKPMPPESLHFVASISGHHRAVSLIGTAVPRENQGMPEKETLERAEEDKREGKAPSTQAGEFVKEEMDHIREGKHGAASTKQAIAIGLSKARRSGVDLPPPKKGSTSAKTRKSAESAYRKGQSSARKKKPSRKRSRATENALKRQPRKAASKKALSRQAKQAANRRGSAARKKAAQKAVRTKGAAGRKQAAKKAAATRMKRAA